MTSFAVIIWVYKKSGMVTDSSLLAICSAVPYLIVSMFGGAVADNISKKKIMLVCDTAAAVGSCVILMCYLLNRLDLWILCAVNMLSGLMNAFQTPASQVTVTLLIDKEDYTRIGGIQSIVGSVVSILTPISATGLLSIGGLGLIVAVDLCTFVFAFFTLLFAVKIPDTLSLKEKSPTFSELIKSTKEGISFIKKEQGILTLLALYGVLNFVGAVSFDSMYSPLVLARTGNSEFAVGVVSAFMAAGCMTAGILISFIKHPKNKLLLMYIGSFMCLVGIMLFGVGRNIYAWCATVFIGCFGAPVYQTFQTVILRERVDVDMQGRIFSLQGMITQFLTPMGYLIGALLADYILEPLMKKQNTVQKLFAAVVGTGNGSGIAVIFVLAGSLGIIILALSCKSPKIRNLEKKKSQKEKTEGVCSYVDE